MTTKDITKEEAEIVDVSEKAAKKPATRTAKAKDAYIEAVGRRKTSTARVRITDAAKSSTTVNGKDLAEYFVTAELQKIINDTFEKSKVVGKFTTTVLVHGGGIHSQAEAVRHGLSRALVESDTELRTRLKKLGFLKRDQRMKERRKFGLKKARKAPKWSKR